MEVVALMVLGESTEEDQNLMAPLFVEEILSLFIHWALTMGGQSLQQSLSHTRAPFLVLLWLPHTSMYKKTFLDLLTLSADGAGFDITLLVFPAYLNDRVRK